MKTTETDQSDANKVIEIQVKKREPPAFLKGRSGTVQTPNAPVNQLADQTQTKSNEQTRRDTEVQPRRSGWFDSSRKETSQTENQVPLVSSTTGVSSEIQKARQQAQNLQQS